MTYSAQECLEHAEHCRRLAEETPPPLAEECLALALTWTRLADGLDRPPGLSTRLPETVTEELERTRIYTAVLTRIVEE